MTGPDRETGPPAEARHDAPRLLITAGPTQEPIDAVRYLGNRSSGRLGVALADEAARRGWPVTLLLGPVASDRVDPRVERLRFRTTADLEALLRDRLPRCDALVMAAAVADYRPKPLPGGVDPASGKLRRTGDSLTLEFEPTPDLLAACARARRADQLLVGFALEPRDRLLDSARAKLERKGADMIVANPLETMDSDRIEATLVSRDADDERTDGPIPKADFAPWLLDRVGAACAAR